MQFSRPIKSDWLIESHVCFFLSNGSLYCVYCASDNKPVLNLNLNCAAGDMLTAVRSRRQQISTTFTEDNEEDITIIWNEASSPTYVCVTTHVYSSLINQNSSYSFHISFCMRQEHPFSINSHIGMYFRKVVKHWWNIQTIGTSNVQLRRTIGYGLRSW